MKYLLDTCVLLWALEGDRNKITDFLDILENGNNYIVVSVVSYWEIVIKKSLGKLKAPDNLIEIVEQTGFAWLNLEPTHIKQLATLKFNHSDPFDTLLIAQAKAEGFQLLTKDKIVAEYVLLN